MGVDLNSLLYAAEQVVEAVEGGHLPEACPEWPLLKQGLREWREHQARNTLVFESLQHFPADG